MEEQELQRGSEGDEVVALQEQLIELRFKPGDVDGVFGVLTESALKMFQSSLKMAADGVVDETTRERLDEATQRQNEAAEG
jgi:peptidoglycan hydrolase-like protein with peptidoglycan-binding domain